MSNRQVMFTPQVKPGWVGWGVRGLCPSARGLSQALHGWVTASRVQGWARTGLCLIWEQQGDWAGGQWGWLGRAMMPLGQLPVPVFVKATDEIGKRLADNCPMSLAEGVPSQWSPEAGTGDCPGWPLTPPRPLSLVIPHLTAVQEPEPTEAEPEGEKAGAGCLCCVGMGRCWPHREEPPEAGVGPGARTGLRAPSGWTAVGETSRGGFLPGCGFSGRPWAVLCLCKGTGRGRQEGELFSSHSCSTI